MNGSTYDGWKTATPDDDGPIPGDCPVCDGGDGPACSEGCEELILRAKTRRMVRGAYEACRIAMSVAKGYVREGDDARSPRVRAVLDQIGAYRRYVRSLRAILAVQAEDIGEADTLPAPACEEAAQ